MTPSPLRFDLSGFPEPGSEEFYVLPEPLQAVLDNCALFVEEATASRSGPVISRMSCQTEIEEYFFCEGDIELSKSKDGSEIHWQCRKCKLNSGIVIGFEGSRWDLSDIPEKHARQFLCDKYDSIVPYHEFLPDLPFDLTDRDQNRELFDWLDSLEEDERQKMAAMFAEKAMEYEQHIAEACSPGLDPDEIEALLFCDWRSADGPLILRDDLSFDEVEGTYFFRNARIFLLHLLEENGFELTPAGNLKRKYVTLLLDTGHWTEDYVEHLRTNYKVLNEEDVWQLHIIRVLLQQSGLVKKQGDTLKPVQHRIHLVEKEYAGNLYRRLFYTYFREMNISYPIWYDELPMLQEGMGYTLYRLHDLADDWSLSADLLKNILFETVRLELLRSLRSEFEQPDVRLESLVLRPLGLFGLIESRYGTTLKPLTITQDRPEQFRKTALFDRFIEFRF